MGLRSKSVGWDHSDLTPTKFTLVRRRAVRIMGRQFAHERWASTHESSPALPAIGSRVLPQSDLADPRQPRT
jgi:hypothetical protein